jgi:hypothetical protein
MPVPERPLRITVGLKLSGVIPDILANEGETSVLCASVPNTVCRSESVCTVVVSLTRPTALPVPEHE